MKNREDFLELLLLNSKDKAKYQEKMKEFLVTEGRGPKAYCPIQFELKGWYILSRKEFDPIYKDDTVQLNYFRDPERDKKREALLEGLVNEVKRKEYDIFSLERLFRR